jgi:tRNA threonylcarbamoyl adenosine modification protein (Sua5/YciO/YrdC/YwlC family)/tRNA threonylcarbamoyl adenosine modification protein YjeE
MIESICKVDTRRRNIITNLLPGPFTVVLDIKSKNIFKISNLLLSENKTIGVRFPDFELIQKLVSKFKKPITATSANISGSNAVYSIQSLFKQISNKQKNLIDLVVDYGKLPYNKPSTVIDLTSDRIRQLRKGDLIFSSSKSYISKSPDETKKIAKSVLKKYIDKITTKPLVLLLKGPLGAGKTVFAKGLGDYFGIKDIKSPTYIVYDEHNIVKNSKFKHKKFIHGDLYNVQDDEELRNINLERYLIAGNVICVEWGNKSINLINNFTKLGFTLYVEIDYMSRNSRKIMINSISNNI